MPSTRCRALLGRYRYQIGAVPITGSSIPGRRLRQTTFPSLVIANPKAFPYQYRHNPIQSQILPRTYRCKRLLRTRYRRAHRATESRRHAAPQNPQCVGSVGTLFLTVALHTGHRPFTWEAGERSSAIIPSKRRISPPVGIDTVYLHGD